MGQHLPTIDQIMGPCRNTRGRYMCVHTQQEERETPIDLSLWALYIFLGWCLVLPIRTEFMMIFISLVGERILKTTLVVLVKGFSICK